MAVAGVLLLAASACFVANIVRVARHWLRGERLRLREPVVPVRTHATRG